MARRPRDGKAVRDWIMFSAGLIGTAYETLAARVDRPTLLALFAGMMGLPLFLGRDEDRHDKHDEPPDESG